jgi:asparagine synthase (glutamine-hydrolysing)
LYEKETNTIVVARDPVGVRPLYYRVDGERYFFASERAALEVGATWQTSVYEFPPGEVWVLRPSEETQGFHVEKTKYFSVPWIRNPLFESEEMATNAVRVALEAAVQKRMLAERPIAALLSGGLDSSLIAALVQRELKRAGAPPLKTFSIGMKGSTDLEYARRVAAWIGSDHTEIETTADTMWESIPEVIKDIESYDITTIRASVGNWMVAREVSRRCDCKVVFNGDGSDELFGSYLYMYKAPNDSAYTSEVERLLKEIHVYDVLRSDRSISSHGLEPRTPFLDKQFIATVVSIPVEYRRPTKERCEKYILRKAFEASSLLPPEVLWRRKEAFSDGVSSSEKSWYQEIQERIVSNPDSMECIHLTKDIGPKPPTPEAAWYLTQYLQEYSHTGAFWEYWMPKWSPETSDPSARTLSHYS